MKILVVDDDQATRQLLTKLLVSDGHTVVEAIDGVKSIKMFNDESPDLILMDVMMPNMDGIEATRIIKRKAGDKFVPIIFITAKEDDDLLIHCLESGGDDFITKPFKTSVLSAKLVAMRRIFELQNKVKDQHGKLLKIHQRKLAEIEEAESIFDRVVSIGDASSDIFKSYHKPAESFNGDVVMAQKSPQGSLHVLIGDFTGHGIAAAICTMPVLDIFIKMTQKGYHIGRIVEEINRKISVYLPVERFLACCLMSVDWKSHTLKVWSGGMPDVYILNAEKGIRETIRSDKLPLGINTSAKLDTSLQKFNLYDGDTVFAYSDGLIDMELETGQRYGEDRLVNFLNKHVTEASLVESLGDEIESIACRLNDDVTFVEIKCDFSRHFLLDVRKGEYQDSGNWRFELNLDVDAVRSMDPVPVLLSFLDEISALRVLRDRLFTILTEMYSNALEHGLLEISSEEKVDSTSFVSYYELVTSKLNQLESGQITVSLSSISRPEGNRLTISMQDSGKGFDAQALLNQNADITDSNYHGRGILLIKSLSDELWFNEKGNQLNVTLLWSNN